MTGLDKYDRLQQEINTLKSDFSKQIEGIRSQSENQPIPPGFTPDSYPQELKNFNDRWDEWKEMYGVKEIKPQEGDLFSENQVNILISQRIKELFN